MKEKIHEYNISASFIFDSSIVIEATSKSEAEKIARQTLVRMCKDQLSDKNNINIKVIEEHTITPEERVNLESMGVIKAQIRKKNEKNSMVKKAKK